MPESMSDERASSTIAAHRVGRPLFLLAGLWNFVAASSALFFTRFAMGLFFGASAYTGDYHQAMLFRAFGIAVLLFGIGYTLVSRDPSRNRAVVWLGVAGKLAVFGVFTHALVTDHATLMGWGVALGDLLWGFGFLWFLWATRHDVRVGQLVG